MRVQPPGKNKRQKKRIKWLASCTRWRRIGEEQEYGDILLTRISRKPPAFKVEAVTEDGDFFQCGLQKAPKGERGWDVLLPDKGHGEAGIKSIRGRTKAASIKFISTLQVRKHEAASISEETSDE